MRPLESNDLPKYQQVLDSLRREIVTGRYGPGQRLPSEAELVKQFGTSRITIGRAMRELRQDRLIERRAGSGTFVRVAGTSGMTFGLLIPNLGQTEIFEPICQGMAEAARGGDHALLWGHASESRLRGEQALQLCRQYVERRVAGVFFAPLEYSADDAPVNRQIIAALEKARIPVVLLDRCYMPYPQRSTHDLVGVDNRRVGHLAAAHLLDAGCRRLAFLALPHSASTVEARVAGYREALHFRGLPVEASLIQRFDATDRAAVKSFLEEQRPDGFVCANDRTASGLMRNVLALGYRIPDQIRVVGIDDLPIASLLPVPLTTVHQPSRELGRAAMAMMIERMANPDLPTRDVLLASHLVVRESCGTRPSYDGQG